MAKLHILSALIVILLGGAALACDGDDKSTATPTTGQTVTPAITSSPTATASPTVVTPVAGATRITPPEDRSEFVDQLADKEIIKEHCTYDVATSAADCGSRGLYALDPALTTNALCDVFLVEGEPVAVSCAGPAEASLYVIP